MKKDKLVNVIKKYHLNNTIDSVKWVVGADKSLDINFVTSDRTLVGSLRATNIDIEESELGIYTTAQLLKLLSVFGDDIDFSMLKIDGLARTLNMKDKESAVTYMLSDLSVIPIAGKPKALPEFQMQIKATRITVPINASCSGDVEYKSFNSNYLKELMVANSDATSILIEVSNAGLMVVTASNADYSATYYLVEVSHI